MRAESNLLIEQYNEAVLNAVRDVARTGSRLQELDAQTRLQEQRIRSLGFARDRVEALYRRGLSSKTVALDGQMLSQEIGLRKALGGGYRADTPVELTPR
ncbi:hypothetical protein [Caballeronia glebae]|uniref:Outer membrane efflux protein MdtP n=1 Tax=Caballeronia glebae TaxID=1777143 RepID=A0A157ZXY4_9BURK|nr:hypothetical protein [Caballeronia glebae]SAK50365.1 putative outer membrane efflux protein MdtP [Caballeronia glebae]